MWLGWVTGLIIDLYDGPSSYEVRRVIYNVGHRSDCLWEGFAFSTPGLKEKTQRKTTISQTTFSLALSLSPSPTSWFVDQCKVRLVIVCQLSSLPSGFPQLSSQFFLTWFLWGLLNWLGPALWSLWKETKGEISCSQS